MNQPDNYSFLVLYGLDTDSIAKLGLQNVDIQGFKMGSAKFKMLLKEITNLERLMHEELKWGSYYHADEISYVFYSRNRGALDHLFDFLTILSPWKIMPWLEFDAKFLSYAKDGKTVQYYHAPSLTSNTIGSLYRQLENSDIIYFHRGDSRLLNKLLSKYFSFTQPAYYKRLLALYRQAYVESRDYFKFLLLFMIIESLIIDDDTSGVVYKIRRLCSVLVGDDLKMSEEIFKKVGQAYTVRSKLVHQARSTLHEGRYLPFIHSVVCEILMTLMVIDQADDKIFMRANALGFGVKQSLIKDVSFKRYRVLTNNYINFYASFK